MALNIPQASEQAQAGSAPAAGAEVAGAAKRIEGRSPWRLATQRLLHDKASMISLSVIGFIVLLAIFAPVVAAIIGHGPNQQFPAPIGVNASGQPLGPSSRFLFGTDTLTAGTSWSGSSTAPGSRSSSACWPR